MGNVCQSGGAKGADLYWGQEAKKNGHEVIHYTFRGGPDDYKNSRILSDLELKEADSFLKEANKTLKRRYPTRSNYTDNLLRRNYYQIKDAKSLYAVSIIKDNQVAGGTAWAVQMFIDKHNKEICPCYIFDQEIKRWSQWNGNYFKLMMLPIPLAPSGIYTGIGTRNLNKNGKRAIEEVYKQWIRIL